MNPHEEPLHIISIFRQTRNDIPCMLSLVKKIQDIALKNLQFTFINRYTGDYQSLAFEILQGNYPRKKQTAARLLEACDRVLTRGYIEAHEGGVIACLYGELHPYSDFENSERAKKKRPGRKKVEDALDRGIKDSIKYDQGATWKERAAWLEGEGVVLKWDEENLTFYDGTTEEEKTIPSGTFRNKITQHKKN